MLGYNCNYIKNIPLIVLLLLYKRWDVAITHKYDTETIDLL